MTKDELQDILDLHRKWLYGEEGGKRADLSGADLRCADLSGADLRDTDLRRADLSGADLRCADLRRADLRRADLRCVDLRRADLRRADLRRADLRDTDLRCADLSGADLRGVKNAKLVFERMCICPQEGSFIAWKQANYRDDDGYIHECVVKLEIPADAKRSNGASRKCRASKARVMGIETTDGRQLDGGIRVFSSYDEDFTYANGFMVEPTEPFCENRWEECASGIHFFITREEAVAY